MSIKTYITEVSGGTSNGALEATLQLVKDALLDQATKIEEQPVTMAAVPVGAATEQTMLAVLDALKKLIATDGEEVPNANLGAGNGGYAINNPGTLFIGTGGLLKCTLENMEDGNYITYPSLPDGADCTKSVKFIHEDTTCRDISVNIP